MALTFLRGFIGILKSTSLALIISGWMDGWIPLFKNKNKPQGSPVRGPKEPPAINESLNCTADTCAGHSILTVAFDFPEIC